MKRYRALGMLLLCLVVTGLATAAQTSGRWELLGQREVDFRNDRDQIDVGRSEGQFRQLDIRVKDAPIEINNMVEGSATMRPSARRSVTNLPKGPAPKY